MSTKSTTKLRRAAVAVGLLAASAVLSVTTTGQAPALADATRVITGATSCASGIVPYSPYVNYGSGWVGADSSYQIPGTQTKVWTKVIPASATGIELDMFCYANWQEYNGQLFYPYGTWQGYGTSFTPGTSTITSGWLCDRFPVYPGPWVRTCTLSSISYN